MTDSRTHDFAQALQQLEQDHDVGAFVADRFTTAAVSLRPETGEELQGPEGARTYWEQYLGQFADISSRFERIENLGTVGLLEWSSTGTLTSGIPIDYRGVSVLDFDEDGRIHRFVTYYDTARFLRSDQQS